MKKILLIPRIKIHNANALSSPYTIGFPAMTAWLGATHALERALNKTEFHEVKFTSMAVACHKMDLQTYRGKGDFVHSIIGTGNPLDKSGKRSSFIEEARCHLTVSMVIEYKNLGLAKDEFIETVNNIFQSKIKIAGGDIMDCSPAKLLSIHDEASQNKVLRMLMPGHCLIDRRDLMKHAMVEGKDAIDALLDYLKVTHHCEIDEKEKVTWNSNRKENGWIVPIATGFHGISELGKAQNQRDPKTPHRFAESVVTLGEFVMPHRITNIDNILWHYHTDQGKNLYLCVQNKPVVEI